MTTRGRNWLDDEESDSDSDDSELLRVCAEKRRKCLFNAAIVTALWVCAPTQGPQGPKRVDDAPFSWGDHVATLNRLEFKRCYRLTPEAFDELLGLIRSDISTKNLTRAEACRGESPTESWLRVKNPPDVLISLFVFSPAVFFSHSLCTRRCGGLPRSPSRNCVEVPRWWHDSGPQELVSCVQARVLQVDLSVCRCHQPCD